MKKYILGFITVFAVMFTIGCTESNTNYQGEENNSSNIAVPVDNNQTGFTSDAKLPSSNMATSTSTPSTKSTSIDNPKGKLDILTNPAGATVSIDGVSKGVSPIEGLFVDAGIHSVTVCLSGYDSQKEKVEVANSETKKLLYALIPNTKQSSAPILTQEETPTTEVTPTQTFKSSNYQDSQWLSVALSNLVIVRDDLVNVEYAATDSNFSALSIYGKSLFADSQQALNDSDKYEVSPDCQVLKEEYMSNMAQANQIVVYINSGIEEFNNGDTEAADSYLRKARESITVMKLALRFEPGHLLMYEDELNKQSIS